MKFTKEKFKVFHSGGNIGQNLLLVKDIMLKGAKLPVISSNKTISEAIKIINTKKLGIVVVTKAGGFVRGLISDGDIRRAVKDLNKNDKIENIMSQNPIFVSPDTPASKALSIMNQKKITSLCVTSEKEMNKREKKLIAIVHIHNLLNYGIK